MPIRMCFGCGKKLTPVEPTTWTAHEFKCGKAQPWLIPEEFRAEHERTLMWERRSEAAKRGAATRRRIRLAKA